MCFRILPSCLCLQLSQSLSRSLTLSERPFVRSKYVCLLPSLSLFLNSVLALSLSLRIVLIFFVFFSAQLSDRLWQRRLVVVLLCVCVCHYNNNYVLLLILIHILCARFGRGCSISAPSSSIQGGFAGWLSPPPLLSGQLVFTCCSWERRKVLKQLLKFSLVQFRQIRIRGKIKSIPRRNRS